MALIPNRSGFYSKSRDQILLEEAAKGGDPEALYKLGLYFLTVEQKAYKAKEILTKTAENGHAKSMLALSKQYHKDNDMPKSTLWYNKALECDTAESNYETAMFLLQENYLSYDFSTISVLLHKSCDQGNNDAQNIMNIIDGCEDKWTDIQNGDGEAQFHFAKQCIQNSTHNPVLLDIGKYWLEKSIENNCVDAMCYMGDSFFEGNIVKRDLASAKSYYERAIQLNPSKTSPNIEKTKKFTVIGGDDAFVAFFDNCIYYGFYTLREACRIPSNSKSIPFSKIQKITVSTGDINGYDEMKVFLTDGEKISINVGKTIKLDDRLHKEALNEDFVFGKQKVVNKASSFILSAVAHFFGALLFGNAGIYAAKHVKSESEIIVLTRKNN